MSSALVHLEGRAGLRQRLKTCTGMPLLGGYAWEGDDYTPTRNKPFIEDKMIVTAGNAVSHGAIEHKISYIMTLKFPANQGTLAIELVAGRLLDHFKVGTKLTYGVTTFLSYGAERRGGIVQEVDWQILTVAVDLQTFTLE